MGKIDIDIFSLINPQIKKLESECMHIYADHFVTALGGCTGSEVLLGVYHCLKNMPVELSEQRKKELLNIKIQVKKVLNDYNWDVD